MRLYLVKKTSLSEMNMNEKPISKFVIIVNRNLNTQLDFVAFLLEANKIKLLECGEMKS